MNLQISHGKRKAVQPVLGQANVWESLGQQLQGEHPAKGVRQSLMPI